MTTGRQSPCWSADRAGGDVAAEPLVARRLPTGVGKNGNHGQDFPTPGAALLGCSPGRALEHLRKWQGRRPPSNGERPVGGDYATATLQQDEMRPGLPQRGAAHEAAHPVPAPRPAEPAGDLPDRLGTIRDARLDQFMLVLIAALFLFRYRTRNPARACAPSRSTAEGPTSLWPSVDPITSR